MTAAPLPVHISRRKGIGNFQPLGKHFPIDRHTVSQKYHRPVVIVQPPDQILHRNGHLHTQYLKYGFHLFYAFLFSCPPGKCIDPGVHLISPCIHDGADDILTAEYLKGQPVYGRHMDQRLVQCQPQPFRCGRADPKPGKRTRPPDTAMASMSARSRSVIFATSSIMGGKV